MERERLDKLVRDPLAVERQDLAGLKDLAERSPWFTGAQLLRAAGERSLGDVGFDATLQRTAAHLPSREVLYDLVERDPMPAPAPIATLRIVEDHRPAPSPATGPEKPQALEPEKVEMTLEAVVPMVQAVEIPEPVAMIPEVEKPQDAPAVTEIAAQVDEPEEEDPLERQILEAALASAYDLTLHAPAPHIPPQVTEPVTEPVTAAASPVNVPMTIPEVLPATANPSPRPVVARSSRLRFTDWLNETAAEPEAPGTGSAITTRPSEPSEPVIVPVAKAPVAPAVSRDLIDRFIEQESPAPAKKTAFFTPQQAAKRSLDDTAGLVTETLARIYEKQGNLPKAIDAYRKLAVKYPEKSAYFAALSRSLEEQLNP
jgi:hypothetical protein